MIVLKICGNPAPQATELHKHLMVTILGLSYDDKGYIMHEAMNSVCMYMMMDRDGSISFSVSMYLAGLKPRSNLSLWSVAGCVGQWNKF